MCISESFCELCMNIVVDLSIIWMHRYAELVYIWIFWVVDSECWLWIWTCPMNLSLIRMFTCSVVLVRELVSMSTVGFVTCGCQRHTFQRSWLTRIFIWHLISLHAKDAPFQLNCTKNLVVHFLNRLLSRLQCRILARYRTKMSQ